MIDEDALATRYRARTDPHLLAACKLVTNALEHYHPVTVEGAERLPVGGALLVGNHGLLGYETPLFFSAVLRATGRLPRGLADRWFFRVPVVRDVLVRVGGAYGHPHNARRLLEDGELVVVYPGGAREAFKRRARDRYRLSRDRSQGFLKIALELGVPIVPFAAAGVDDTFDVNGSFEGTGRLLMGHDKYDLPRLRGALGPIPRRVPFLFRFGPAIAVHEHAPRDACERTVHRMHEWIWRSAQRLLDDTVATWRRQQATEDVLREAA